MESLKTFDELRPFIQRRERTKTLLFDLDGTLIHSEPLHVQGFVYTLVQRDGELDIQDLMRLQAQGINDELRGVNDVSVFKLIEKRSGVKFRHPIEELLAMKTDFLLSDEVTALLRSPQCSNPELMASLRELKKEGMRMALVSASEKVFVQHCLKTLGIDDLFEIVIAREDTTHTKPDPSPYLHALELLQVDKDDALIFEDSETGLESARKSEIPFIQVCWYS